MNFNFFNREGKSFSILISLSLLFVFPLLSYGIYYRDDLDRAVTGYYGWSNSGRPLAELIIAIASSSGDQLLDIFPYTLIFSCVFLAFSCLLVKKLLDSYELPGSLMSCSLLIFNPFILQNLAYRYDSLSMSLAFLLAILSYTYSHKNIKISTAIKIASGVCALSLYQPCVNIYLGIMAIETCVLAVKKHTTVKFFIRKIIAKSLVFVAFYLVYMFTIARIYANSNSRNSFITLNSAGVNELLNSFSRLNNLIGSYMHGAVIYYFIVTTLILAASIIFYITARKAPPISTLFKLLISFLIFYISLVGPTIALHDAPIFARTIVSFSCLFVMFSIIFVQITKTLRFIALVAVIPSLAFSAQLSNALHEQREHEDYVINMISYDILNRHGIEQTLTVGTINFSKRAELIAKERPLVNGLLSRATEFLATFQLYNKGLPGVKVGYGIETKNKQILNKFKDEKISPFVSNSEYRIYEKNGVAVVELGSGR